MNRFLQNANRITFGNLARGLAIGVLGLLAGCTQGPGGGGIGLASGQAPDPATVDFPIFYIRHQIPQNQDNVTRVRPFVKDDNYSATLWKRDRASPGSPESELTARLRVDPLGKPEDRYDIKDLSVAPDGLHVAFAMRGPLDDFKEDEPPTWHIWEYNIQTDTLHRVITSNIIAEEGQDVSPAYLPDGRILFSSTRQRQAKAVLLDEGKAQFEAATEAKNESAFVLHVMNADGTGIHQISFNPSSDLYPTVLQSGRVLFTRWDNAPGGINKLNLYTSNPDGTDTQLHYGVNSHASGTDGLNHAATATTPATALPDVEFVRAREMSDGRLMVLARERTDVDFGGNLMIVDAKNFVDIGQALLASTAAAGTAQKPATLNDVRTIPGPSPGGRFESGFPLWDGSGRILVSWTQCRLFDVHGSDPTRIIACDATNVKDPEAVTAPPLYSIWMFNPAQNTILPVMAPVESVMVTEAVAAQPRVPLPPVILDKQAPLDLDADLVAEGAGMIDIRSVYDVTGTLTRNPTTIATTIANNSNPTNAAYPTRIARFVRIEKPVSIPDDNDIADPDNSAFGFAGVMREIVGYAPVEPDGSVRMKVPANIAFQLSVLDVNGRRIASSQGAWMQVRPGEVLQCDGCHQRRNATNGQAPPEVHGRKGLYTSAYAGATATGGAFPGTVNTISPDAGDTMARARSRAGSSCIDTTTMTERCGLQSITPSANVIYNEIWKPAAAPTESFAYNYQSLNTAMPSNTGCFPVWTPTCRITIHYTSIGTPVRNGHIHPLWSVPRPAGGVDDGTGTGTLIFPQTCTRCHSRVDKVDPALVQLPDASLELTDEVSDEDALQLRAFRELLTARPQLELVGGAIQVLLVQQRDANGNPVFDDNGNPVMVPATFTAPMNVGNARSSRFFTVMNDSVHAGMLSTAELRLISEWLDIGAQYYNDPFPPTPQN